MKNYIIDARHLIELTITGSVMRKIKNWQTFLADYLGLLRKPYYMVKLTSGARIKLRANTTDRWSIHEIIVRNDYKLNRLSAVAPIVIDLGSAEGAFAVAAAIENKNALVIALEPDKTNFTLARENIRLNKLETQVKLLQYACAAKNGIAYLYESSDRRAQSMLRRSNSSQRIRTIMLQALLNKFKVKTCDFLKVDIEGSEYKLFYSLPKSTFKKLETISMEYHNINKKEKNGKSLAKFIFNSGFTVNYKDSIDHSVGQLFATRNRYE